MNLNFNKYFDIRRELEDFEYIHSEIEKAIPFRGTNLWILVCAILVASVGLNMNSTAVIIGAMLISPLMGPINGLGYSIATYDGTLFKHSINNLIFAVVVSLIASTIYFVITPVNTAHSELLARTSPTIYDVFIAFFGGLAGILAISSKLKGNVIPGVAIATALMPPICTAGYGLATFQFNYFFGAMYLFTINTVCITVASLVICKVFKFPIRSIVDDNKRKNVSSAITVVLLITIVPSVIFGYNLVKKEQFIENATIYIKEVAVLDKSYLIDKTINPNNHSIELVYSGYGPSPEGIMKIKERAHYLDIDSAKVMIVAGTDVEVLKQSTNQYLTEAQELENRLNITTVNLNKAHITIDSILNIPTFGEELLKEIKQIYPQIVNCAYSETIIYSDSTSTERVPLIIFSHDLRMRDKDKAKVIEWAKMRLDDQTVRVLFTKM